MLRAVHTLFEKHKIWYTISYGTLLGAVRHRNLIPWDDDADIYVKIQDVSKIMTLEEEFDTIGIRIIKTWKLLHLELKDSPKHPQLDMFIIDDSSRTVKRCRSRMDGMCQAAKKWWWTRNFGFPSEWLRDRRPIELGDIQLWAPVGTMDLLEFIYGPKFLTECKTQRYNHVTKRYHKQRSFGCGKLPKPQIIL